jgi:hypothetical protein
VLYCVTKEAKLTVHPDTFSPCSFGWENHLTASLTVKNGLGKGADTLVKNQTWKLFSI